MTTTRDLSQPTADSQANLRRRNDRVRELLQEWRTDNSGYDERIWPILKAEMDADRLSSRRRFGE